MSNKVIIKTIRKQDRQWNGKDIYNIELADGRRGSSFSAEAKDWAEGMEVELDIKEGKEYQGEMQYYFNTPRKPKGGGGFQRDYNFEKRKTALECACRLSHASERELLVEAERLLNWLNK